MIVSLQKSTDKQSLEIYKEILDNRDEFDSDGIQIIDSKQEALAPGFTEGIIVGIIGGVSVHYIVKFIDFVIDKIRQKKAYNIYFIIQYKEQKFFIPENKDECLNFFEDIEEKEEKKDV